MFKNLQSKVLLLIGLLLAGVSGAWAEDVTYSFTISASDFNTTSYVANNNEKTSNAVCTTDNTKTYEVKWTSYQVMKSGNDMQWQKNKGYIYNSTDLGTINSVTINSSNGSFTTYYGTEEKPTSGTTVGNGFFNTVVGSETGKTSSVVVTFTISEGGDAPGAQSVATTVTIDDENITNTDVYVSTEAGSLSAKVLDNESNAIDGATVTWSGNNDDVATIDAETGVVTLVAAGTVTFKATYAGVDNKYKASSATYEMTVTSSAPYVQPTTVEINMNYQWLGSGNGSNLSSNQLPIVNTDDNVTTTITDGTSTRPRGDADYIRLYKGSTISFAAPDGYTITEIVFVTGGNNTWNAPTPDSGELSDKTWTGEAESVVFTLGSGNCFISKATITLEAIVPQVLSSIALSGDYPTIFHVGDNFSNDGMVVTATYESGKTADVTAEATFTGYDMGNAGEQTVTVSYTENEVTETATYGITVKAPATLTSITLSGDYPTEFQQGDAFSSDGIVVTANYDDDTTSDVTAEAEFSGYDMATIGEQTVTVTYQNKTASYGITVVEKKGTSDNPYTVAEARAAIDAGTGVTGVYATGIVSEIVTAYNSQYGNITYNISADGETTSNQLQAYRGKSYNGDNFTSEDDIKVGDVVVIYGNLKKYNSTYEFDQNNQLFSLERPVITTPYIEVNTNAVEATAAGSEGTITVAYNNIKEVVAEVKFYEADGTTPATYDWIEAEIDAQTNNVEYIIAENESTEARTAYMKVYALDGEAQDVYSELITITQAGYVVDYATLPFEFNSGKSAISNTTGLTQEGLGNDYSSPAPKLKFDNPDDHLVLKINEVPGTLTFDIKGNSFQGGTFTLQTSADGVEYANLEVYGDADIPNQVSQKSVNLASDVRYIKWIYTKKEDGNVGLGNIVLTAPISVTLNSYGFATYASSYALDFTTAADNGYSAWAVSEIEGNKVKFTEIKESVNAGTGVLLMGEPSANVTLNRTTAGTFNGTNLLEGITEDTEVTSGQYYGLSGNNFVRVGDTTIPAGKALLPANLIGNNNARLAFVFEDEATGIENISQEETVKAMFDLQGRKVQKAGRGVYVVNGKKVVKK